MTFPDFCIKRLQVQKAISYHLLILESSPQITKGSINHCNTGIRIEGDKAEPVLDDLTIYRNMVSGIEAYDLAKARVSRCHIAYNTEIGIKNVRALLKIINNDISYNGIGVFIEDAAPLVGGNRILYNKKSEFFAKDIELQSLRIDFNYFGSPDKVYVLSSHQNFAAYSITMLKTKDIKGAREQKN